MTALALLALPATPAAAHSETQRAVVERGPAESEFVTHSAHLGGQWTFRVVGVEKRPSWAIVEVFVGDAGDRRRVGYSFLHTPAVGDERSAMLPASPDGEYAVRVGVWGGSGASVTIATSHPLL